MKIRYKDASGYKYQLVEKAVFKTPIVNAAAQVPGFLELAQDGAMSFFAGYAWDGASGPTVDVLKLPFCRLQSAVRASLLHDGLYQLEREGKLGQEWRPVADELLYQVCVEDGFWPWRARTWRWAVRKFGASSAARQPLRVFEAP
jgi:hypothetical protein